MNLDDLVCECFGVSLRKILSFLRVQKPWRASQISECLRAGTGCGRCRPELQRLFEEFQDEQESGRTGGEPETRPQAP